MAFLAAVEQPEPEDLVQKMRWMSHQLEANPHNVQLRCRYLSHLICGWKQSQELGKFELRDGIQRKINVALKNLLLGLVWIVISIHWSVLPASLKQPFNKPLSSKCCVFFGFVLVVVFDASVVVSVFQGMSTPVVKKLTELANCTCWQT